MEFTDEELECIKYFPHRTANYSLSFFDYFESKFRHISGITKKQLDKNTREDLHTHNLLLNEKLKIIGKDFLVIDSERFIQFSVHFIDDIGYEIYVNKDNSADNRIHFLNHFYDDKIMISDSQTEELLKPEHYEDIKNKLLAYMNLYKRFEIFWNSVACYLSSAIKEYGYWGYFLHDSKADSHTAKYKNGLLYSYGIESQKFYDTYGFCENHDYCEKRNVLIPFENFSPVLNDIIEDMKRKPNVKGSITI